MDVAHRACTRLENGEPDQEEPPHGRDCRLRRMRGLAGCLGSLLLLGGCGILASQPGLPSLSEVQQAKRADSAEWNLLGEVENAWHEKGREEALRLVAGSEDSPRMAALLQDLQALDGNPKEEESFWFAEFERDPGFLSAYLAARTCLDPGHRKVLAEKALEFNPASLQARVLRIGSRPFRVGEVASLQRLIALLAENPGCAEGWQLLGHLASMHGREDLALQAAMTEPWTLGTASEGNARFQARAALAAGEPEKGLRILEGWRGPLSRDSLLLLASAYVEAGNPSESRAILEGLLESNSQDPQALFNLALLQCDHFMNQSEAAALLVEFIRIAEVQGAPLPRILQARLWLKELQTGVE